MRTLNHHHYKQQYSCREIVRIRTNSRTPSVFYLQKAELKQIDYVTTAVDVQAHADAAIPTAIAVGPLSVGYCLIYEDFGILNGLVLPTQVSSFIFT